MDESALIKTLTERITTLFSSGEKDQKQPAVGRERQRYMRLNFFLLSSFLTRPSRREKTKRPFSPFSFFTSNILNSDNPHLVEIIKQAQRCSQKDLGLFLPLRQLPLKSELTMRRVIQWHLSKFIKSEGQLKAFVEMMKRTPPDVFRSHLITLIGQRGKEEGGILEEVEKAAKEQESKWELWKSHYTDGDPFRVSRI